MMQKSVLLLLALCLVLHCEGRKRRPGNVVHPAPHHKPFDKNRTWDPLLAEKHRITSLPGLPFGYDRAMFAGDVSVYEPRLRNNGSIFYWFLESQDDPDTAPLLIWLNGGPGCSSMEGLLIEHGPFLAVATGYDLELNPYSWNKKANVLYIDQPVGTGFARVEDKQFANSQADVNSMFSAFMLRWFDMFPQYQNRSLFISGESYAGRYIPNFVPLLVEMGRKVEGVLIGNGWTHPMMQSEALPTFAFAMGFVSSQQKKELDDALSECRAAYGIDAYSLNTWTKCERIQNWPMLASGDTHIGKVNMYDVRLYDTTAGGAWPWQATGEKDYLNREDVRAALHVTSGVVWEECSDEVGQHLTHEDMFPTLDQLRALLPTTPVLLYNGQFDWICNHLGVEWMLDAMEFEGKEDFMNTSRRGLWVSGSRLAGYVKQGGNLTFLTVLGASHMAPMDKRAETLDMIHRFFSGKSFADLVSGPLIGADDPHLAVPHFDDIHLQAVIDRANIPLQVAPLNAEAPVGDGRNTLIGFLAGFALYPLLQFLWNKKRRKEYFDLE